MKTSIILFFAVTVCILATACCGPVKTDFKYKPFKEPQAADAPSNSKPAVKIPFKEPLATDTEKIDREYLIEMCKSLIIQGHLPYVVMSDLKDMPEKKLIDKAIKGQANAAKRHPLFAKFRRAIINRLTNARMNLNEESHEESSELWSIFVENEEE